MMERFQEKFLHQPCPKCGQKGPHKVYFAKANATPPATVDRLQVWCQRCDVLMGEYAPLDGKL